MKSGSLPVLSVPKRDSRRSVIVVLDADGTELWTHRIDTGYENRRVKNDQEDAQLLADLLRMGHLPEAWMAPKSVRHQRELIRYRRKLSQLRASLKSQIHAVLGKEGLLPPLNHLWGPGGAHWLDDTDMAADTDLAGYHDQAE